MERMVKYSSLAFGVRILAIASFVGMAACGGDNGPPPDGGAGKGGKGGNGGAASGGGAGDARGGAATAPPCAGGPGGGSAFGVAGVGCDPACTTGCSACVIAKTGQASGVCKPITAGTDPDSECPQETPSTCGMD